MINTNKIKGRMAELGITQKDLAKALKISPPTVSQKINNIRPMDLSEAEIMTEILKIQSEEFAEYFFAARLHSATKRHMEGCFFASNSGECGIL